MRGNFRWFWAQWLEELDLSDICVEAKTISHDFCSYNSYPHSLVLSTEHPRKLPESSFDNCDVFTHLGITVIDLAPGVAEKASPRENLERRKIGPVFTSSSLRTWKYIDRTIRFDSATQMVIFSPRRSSWRRTPHTHRGSAFYHEIFDITRSWSHFDQLPASTQRFPAYSLFSSLSHRNKWTPKKPRYIDFRP